MPGDMPRLQGMLANVQIPSSQPGPASPDNVHPDLGRSSGGPQNTPEEHLQDYYALQAPEDLADAVLDIVDTTKQMMRGAGIYRRARLNYNLFYAREGNSMWEENLRQDGDNGGSMFMSVNVLKNSLDHLMSMVTTHKPAVDPVTVNGSQSANDITSVAKALIDYRLHKLKDIKAIDAGLKQCPVLGAAFVHGFWNPYKGGKSKPGATPQKGQGIASQILPNGQAVTPLLFRGDICFETVSSLDVFYDLSATCWGEVNDVVVRSYRNRYDLIVQYPDAADAIKQAPAKSTMMYDEYLPTPTFAMTTLASSKSQDAMVEVWTYYHRRTAAVPYGRMQIQLPGGEVLDSSSLPDWTEDFPLHHMCPDVMIGSSHGYAATTSSGGLQEGLNIGASAMLTNMSAFSRKLIIAAKGTDVEASSITGDLKLLEMEFNQNGQPPLQALDLMGSQQPLLEMLGWFVGQIEQDTGANSIVRGDPKGVTAGVAINLYQSMALQFASPYEEARADAISWMATTVVKAYQAHPDIEREVRVLGASKVSSLQNFYGRELDGIDSFTVDPGNPATRTLAMRYNMATALKQDGVPIQPDKLVHLMKTGDWDGTVEGSEALNDIIRAENEQLLNGQPVHAIPGDDPVRHAQGHLSVLSNQRVRTDPALVQNALTHLNEHMMQLAQGDPIVKLAAGMLPMGPFPPPDSQPAHGDTPPPSPGAPPAPQQHPAPKPAPKGATPGPKKAPDPMAPPGAPPVPGIPGTPN